LSLVKTATFIRFDRNVSPMQLPITNPDPRIVTLLGWGRSEDFGEMSVQLQKLNKFMWTNPAQCLDEMGGSHPWFDQNKICTFSMGTKFF
jgi:hypothetical protein